MRIEKWIAGYKVDFSEWIVTGQYLLNIQYFRPGTSIMRPPDREVSHLLMIAEPERISDYLHSMVEHFAMQEERRVRGQLVPIKLEFPEIK